MMITIKATFCTMMLSSKFQYPSGIESKATMPMPTDKTILPVPKGVTSVEDIWQKPSK